jgi:hypothetical protein
VQSPFYIPSFHHSQIFPSQTQIYLSLS